MRASSMKIIALILLSSCFASSAAAEQPVRLQPQPLTAHRSGVRMRTAGITLTAIGVTAIVHGIILMAVEGHRNNTCGGIGDPCGDAKGLLMVPGAIMLGVGGTFAAAGIPLWIIGQKRAQSASPIAFALFAGGQGQ